MRRRSLLNSMIITALAACMTVTAMIPTSADAVMVAHETALAGINLSLDKLAKTEVETGSYASLLAAIDPEAAKKEEDNNTLQEQTGSAIHYEMYDELAEPEDEHVKLNLNYDRLGIAKVDTYLNVRKKPSTNSKIVGKLIKNAGCHIYKIRKGWAKIVSGKVTGYVKKEYLVTDKEAEEMATKVGSKVATVLSEGLRVRALPSTDAPIYSVLSQDEDFDIYREHLNAEWLDKFIKKHIKKKTLKTIDYDSTVNDLDNWVCVSVDNDYAFVAKEYIEISYKLKRAVKVSQLKTDGSGGVSSTRASLVEYAKQFLGNRYVYGGSSLTNGTDCSGFTMSVYAHFGYGLPRTSGAQAGATRSISYNEAKPGDLFFYSNGSRVNHVALYIGGGMVIHASNPRSGIKISNAFYRHPVKIGRYLSN